MKKIKFYKSQILQKQLNSIIKESEAKLYLKKEIALIKMTQNSKQLYFQTGAIFKIQTALLNN
jgi:hypothetical protein